MPPSPERFDVVVVGGGPAGMAAATAAAGAPARTLLLERRDFLGGNVYADSVEGPPSSGAAAARESVGRSGAHVWLGAEVVGVAGDSTLRVVRAGAVTEIAAGKLVLATGARERFLPFPGWTLPNVTGAGGAQLLAKAGSPVRGRRIVVAGTGPLLLAAAAYLRERGAEIPLIAEQAPRTRLARWVVGVAMDRGRWPEARELGQRLRGVPYRTSCWVTRAEGDDRVRRVWLRRGGREWSEPCDGLAVGFHLVPNTELAELLGCRVVDGRVAVDASLTTSVPRVLAAGEPLGIGGRELAECEGRLAGLVAAGRTELIAPAVRQRRRRLPFRRALERTFALDPRLRGLVRPETVVCRCEDVVAARLGGLPDGRSARLQTRCGMGRCQGRVCGPATEFLWGWQLRGTRPPLSPVPLAALLGAAVPEPEPRGSGGGRGSSP